MDKYVLPADLAGLQVEMEAIARDFGLDFPPIIYQMMNWREISVLAALDGFPVRYPHWRFGMEYEHMRKSYAYGLHRIYEMVINTDPCYAYLLTSNKRVDQKLVMLHVCGHAHFFKNNLWFAHTNRKMMDEMANHATRIQRYIDRYGLETVEEFIDACLSIDDLIDVHSVAIRRREEQDHGWDRDDEETSEVALFPAKDYMDGFINPREWRKAERKRLNEEKKVLRGMPKDPERDILLFVLENAPLKNWQRDVLEIIREESYYFAPQRQTKIMNEGFAAFVHTRLMTNKALEPDEMIDYAEHHSGTVAASPTRVNPYRLGLALFRDIEDRWNRGAFGREYDQCDDWREKKNWDRKLGLGLSKVLEVVRVMHDIGFVDEFFTEEFAHENLFYTYEYSSTYDAWVIGSRKFPEIKNQLLFQLTNFGRPVIQAVDGNYGNRGELLLLHTHDGKDLDKVYAEGTLRNLYKLWGRPVHLGTKMGTDEVLYSCTKDEVLIKKPDVKSWKGYLDFFRKLKTV